MGNKQAVFTHEQLEAYQVWVMDQAISGLGSLVVFLAEEMGTESFHTAGRGSSQQVVLGCLCVWIQAAVGSGRGRRHPPTPPHQAGSGLSRYLSPQDCTFFTRKEIMRSV